MKKKKKKKQQKIGFLNPNRVLRFLTKQIVTVISEGGFASTAVTTAVKDSRIPSCKLLFGSFDVHDPNNLDKCA